MSRASQIASRAYSRAAGDFGSANVDRLLLYGGLFLVGFVAYKAWRVKQGFDKAAEKAGEKVANILEWISPFDIGEMLYYTVQFPDGSRHAIGSRDVDKDGFFRYGGKRYRMAIDRSIKTGVNKFAVPQ